MADIVVTESTHSPADVLLRIMEKDVNMVRWGGIPDSKVRGANMGPTWVLSAPDGPHVGPMNLAIRGGFVMVRRGDIICQHIYHTLWRAMWTWYNGGGVILFTNIIAPWEVMWTWYGGAVIFTKVFTVWKAMMWCSGGGCHFPTYLLCIVESDVNLVWRVGGIIMVRRGDNIY